MVVFHYVKSDHRLDTSAPPGLVQGQSANPGAPAQAGLLAMDSARAQVQRPQKLECRPFQVPAGWGYDITLNDKKYIHQDRIPAVPGHKVFSSKEDAQKVGNLMMEKLKNGEFPPAVSYQEMKNLGVVFN